MVRKTSCAIGVSIRGFVIEGDKLESGELTAHSSRTYLNGRNDDLVYVIDPDRLIARPRLPNLLGNQPSRQPRSPFFEIALALVRLDHVASVIVNADHSSV